LGSKTGKFGKYPGYFTPMVVAFGFYLKVFTL